MVQVHFSKIRDLNDLAQYLGCEVAALQMLAHAPRQLDFYDELKIPKRRHRDQNRVRTVYRARESRLARIHKVVADAVAEASKGFFPGCVQGFVQGRSIKTNALVHLGKKVVLHADIKGFFEAIERTAVVAAFECLGCLPEIAEILGRLCTLDGVLPQGVHSSPVLSNLVCRHLDADLMLLARAQRCSYTRYVDDITFSGDEVPPEVSVETILRMHGFELRDGKCRVQRRGRSQVVTGLSVADSTQPRVPRKLKRQLRLVLHYASRYGLEGHLRRVGSSRDPELELNRLAGQLWFVSSVEPEVAQRLLGDLDGARASVRRESAEVDAAESDETE